eukprot:gene14023-biopygen2737
MLGSKLSSFRFADTKAELNVYMNYRLTALGVVLSAGDENGAATATTGTTNDQAQPKLIAVGPMDAEVDT